MVKGKEKKKEGITIKIKKMLGNTIGVTVGGVGMQAAQGLGAPWGTLVGTTMGAGLVKSTMPMYSPSKKKRR